MEWRGEGSEMIEETGVSTSWLEVVMRLKTIRHMIM